MTFNLKPRIVHASVVGKSCGTTNGRKGRGSSTRRRQKMLYYFEIQNDFESSLKTTNIAGITVVCVEQAN